MTTEASKRRAGEVVIAGFPDTVGERFLEAMRRGHRGGAILFRRNLPDLATTHALTSAIHRAFEASGQSGAALVAVDEEGGRVARLPAPFPRLPPMRRLGERGDTSLTRGAAGMVGRRLRALGFTLDFAPVADVDSNPDNPIIGDRSFSRDPGVVAAHAVAFAEGLFEAGVLACGKHVPGHGDTDTDSHVALPVVRHGLERLGSLELAPFRALARAGVASLMTAHVVVEALDAARPATLSPKVLRELVREHVGFGGLLVSDDLEMAAVAARHDPAESAVLAIAAGCDALLVCSDEDAADRVVLALAREAEESEAFRARLDEARERCAAARRSVPLRAHASLDEALACVAEPDAAALHAALAEGPRA